MIKLNIKMSVISSTYNKVSNKILIKWRFIEKKENITEEKSIE